MSVREVGLILLFIWNVVVFFLYGSDKQRAIQKRWRISERTLLLSALLGGGIGAFAGMRLFRHKTRRLRFQFLVPLALALTVALVVLVNQNFIIL